MVLGGLLVLVLLFMPSSISNLATELPCLRRFLFKGTPSTKSEHLLFHYSNTRKELRDKQIGRSN